MKYIKTSNIIFFHDYRTLPLPIARLRRVAEKISRDNEIIRGATVNVILVSDYKIRRLNRKYRKRDRVTDVLSFPFPDSDFLGEIYISLQRAAVQARRYGCTYSDEVTRLFVHGLLHLLGYDHQTGKDRQVMEVQEKRYCLIG